MAIAGWGPLRVPPPAVRMSGPGSVAGGWKTCHVPRRTWLDSKIDVFLEELAASGMHLGRQRAGELITGQVRAVAALMRVTEATARSYLDDEIIKDMARRMLFEVAGERPGADLMEAPRTVPLPLALVGITVAALAEALQVRAANEPPDHLGDVITTYAQTLFRARADHRRHRAKAGRQPGRDPGPASVAAPRGQVHQRRRRPGRERRQTPGRDSRDGTQPARRDPAPGRRRTDRDHYHGRLILMAAFRRTGVRSSRMSDVPGPRRFRAAGYGSGFQLAAVVIAVTGVVLLAGTAFLVSYAGIRQIAVAAGVSPWPGCIR